MRTKKDISKEFLTLCSKGESRKAFKLHVGKKFKHHNPYFRGDAEALMTAMEESAKSTPNEIFEVRNIIEEGNLVWVHSYIQQAGNNMEISVVHILKFDGDKINEAWDIIQPFPENVVNENGMF